MFPYRVIAIPTSLAERVRRTGRSPGYGHPTYTELATGYGPCRHCLRTFRIGEERRTLFTYDPFYGLEQLPLPGPVFVHAEACERYAEDAGYPEVMAPYATILSAYARGRRLMAELEAGEGEQAHAVQRLLSRLDVDYILVRDKAAGCYDFRIERG